MGHHEAAIEIPLHEHRDEDAAQRHEELGSEEIEKVEETAIPYLYLAPRAKRQRAGRSQQHADERDHDGSLAPRKVIVLVDEGRGYLVHRDGAGEGCQEQEHIEHAGEQIAKQGHGRKGLIEDMGQGDIHQARTGIGSHARH